MKRLLAILVGVAMVCGVVYLFSLNPTQVDFNYTPTRSFTQVHLVTLLVFAFLAGVLLMLAGIVLQAGGRALLGWGQQRRERRSSRIEHWENQGEELVWRGDTRNGRALLQKAWRRRPNSPYAVLALAASYRDTGELQRAREILIEAVAQYHTNPDLLMALAETQRVMGDRSGHIDALEHLRALHPRSPRAIRALRDAYVEVERWPEASALQEALIREVGEPIQAGRERGYLAVLRYQAAIGLSDPQARVQALEALADSGETPVLVSLGDALLASGHEDEASVLWERALRNSPRTVFVERLAAIAREPRHRERLRSLLRKLRADRVHADSVRLLVAQLYLADGDPNNAASELEALQSPTIDLPQLHRLWAEVHLRRGQLAHAVAAFARVTGVTAAHVCKECGRTTREWVAWCPHCHHWDSYRSTVEIAVA